MRLQSKNATGLDAPVEKRSRMTIKATNSTDISSGGLGPLIDLLEQQRGLFERMYSLSQQQAKSVANGQTEWLLSILAQRQKYTDEVTSLNAELAPYRASWSAVYANLSDAYRRRVNELINGIQSLLSQIVEQDNHDQACLQQNQTTITHELGQIDRAGEAHQAYRHKVATSSVRLTDRQG